MENGIDIRRLLEVDSTFSIKNKIWKRIKAIDNEMIFFEIIFF